MNNVLTDRGKLVVAIIAAVIMYFTPDPIDEIITALLALFGVQQVLVIGNKKDADKT